MLTDWKSKWDLRTPDVMLFYQRTDIPINVVRHKDDSGEWETVQCRVCDEEETIPLPKDGFISGLRELVEKHSKCDENLQASGAL